MPEWNGHLEIFSCPQEKKILGNICFSEQIFYRKQSAGVPEIGLSDKYILSLVFIHFTTRSGLLLNQRTIVDCS